MILCIFGEAQTEKADRHTFRSSEQRGNTAHASPAGSKEGKNGQPEHEG